MSWPPLLPRDHGERQSSCTGGLAPPLGCCSGPFPNETIWAIHQHVPRKRLLHRSTLRVRKANKVRKAWSVHRVISWQVHRGCTHASGPTPHDSCTAKPPSIRTYRKQQLSIGIPSRCKYPHSRWTHAVMGIAALGMISTVRNRGYQPPPELHDSK